MQVNDANTVSAIMSSTDGINWTDRASVTDSELTGIAYGDNSFVAVGENGAILQSGGNQPPRLGPVSLLASGGLEVTINGAPGQSYQIQASTNLLRWMTLASIVTTNGAAQFTDTSAAGLPCRFYRAVAP
jgi:hypothetical protein